jgi:hypothetical protein
MSMPPWRVKDLLEMRVPLLEFMSFYKSGALSILFIRKKMHPDKIPITTKSHPIITTQKKPNKH